MKKFKFSALICIVLVITMLIPFGSAAAKENATKPVFVAPEYKSYVAGTESNLDIELDYTPNSWLGFIVTDKSRPYPEGAEIIREYDFERMIALMN